MLSILFLRKVRRLSGGQIKVRDYFEHCLQHPAPEPYVYFTPDSSADAGLWANVPAAHRVSEVDVDAFDLLFVAGRDWHLLPGEVAGEKVINLIQGVRHADPTDRRFAYLSRPALRICVSDEVRAAIASRASGEVVVIPPGVPLEEDITIPGTPVAVNGRLIPSSAPGFGVELDPSQFTPMAG